MINRLTQVLDTAISQSGGWLTNRAIRFLGHIVAMVVILKLTWIGGLTVEFFAAYCTFIAGDASLAQVLKTKAAVADESK